MMLGREDHALVYTVIHEYRQCIALGAYTRCCKMQERGNDQEA